MKRYLRHRVDPGLGRWVQELASTLAREGTRARHALEGVGGSLDDPLAASRLQARIRSIFIGRPDLAELHAAPFGDCFGRGRCWT